MTPSSGGFVLANLANVTRMTKVGIRLILLAAGLANLHVTAERASATRGMVTPIGSCTSLEGRRIAASEIGLPTTGASVVSAHLVAAAGQRVSHGQVVLAIPEYCRVKGIIAPVDPQAPTINFHVNVPTSWNGKLIQLGGSGLNGGIPVALTTSMQWGPESIPRNAPYALSRGFVTYGSDSGHTNAGMRVGGPGFAVDWMSNQEALTNFASAQKKKTRDVAVVLVKTLYGVGPRHSYFMGTSQGGREALMVAQRFPQDYDGVFSQITNEIVPPYVDVIAMLDDWVEKGKAPADAPVLTSMDTAPPFNVTSSLPMCRYPRYPRYKGRADPKNAGSYTCAKP